MPDLTSLTELLARTSPRAAEPCMSANGGVQRGQTSK
jgi:hypothetical protein